MKGEFLVEPVGPQIFSGQSNSFVSKLLVIKNWIVQNEEAVQPKSIARKVNQKFDPCPYLVSIHRLKVKHVIRLVRYP